MTLREWRIENNLTLAVAAKRLGLHGVNPAARFQRYETGESRPDADLIERIQEMTGGAVGPSEMHATRLSYLNSKDSVPSADATDAADLPAGVLPPVSAPAGAPASARAGDLPSLGVSSLDSAGASSDVPAFSEDAAE